MGPAHVGHPRPRLNSRMMKPEGSKFRREKEYAWYQRREVWKPVFLPGSGTGLLCDFGQALPLSGLQVPYTIIKKEKLLDRCRLSGFLELIWELFLGAGFQHPAGIFVPRLTPAWTGCLRILALTSCASEWRRGPPWCPCPCNKGLRVETLVVVALVRASSRLLMVLMVKLWVRGTLFLPGIAKGSFRWAVLPLHHELSCTGPLVKTECEVSPSNPTVCLFSFCYMCACVCACV